MGRLEQAAEDLFGHGIGPEPPDVAAFGDHAVDGVGIVFGEAPATGIGGPLARPRGVESWRRGRSGLTIRGGHRPKR